MKCLENIKNIWYNKLNKRREEEKNMKALDLANHIIVLSREERAVTNLRVQKILYYVQGYFFREFGREAFYDDIYCWRYGPVVPQVYFKYSRNGCNALTAEDSIFISTNQEEALIKKVVHQCNNLSTSALVQKTHDEIPWKYTRQEEVIYKKVIYNFFKSNDPLKITM